MSYASEHLVHCTYIGCSATYRGSKWDAIRAYENGWYQFKDGTARCPKHRPAWTRTSKHARGNITDAVMEGERDLKTSPAHKSDGERMA